MNSCFDLTKICVIYNLKMGFILVKNFCINLSLTTQVDIGDI